MTEGDGDDPRVTGEHVRRCGPCDDVVLVGVVHDHPASTYRVRRVVDEVEPVTLALELPPAAVPLYEQYALSARQPPTFGGEMSGAIQAASTDHVVGIDGPSAGFLGRLLASFARTNPSASTVRGVLAGTASAARDALRCRVAASLAAWIGLKPRVGDPVAHDCSFDDDPETQADDEGSHVRRAEVVLNTFGASPGSEYRKRMRESHMADRLRSLRRAGDEGPVVAVVGIGHLDEVAGALDSGPDVPS